MGNIFGSQPAVQDESDCGAPYYYYPPKFGTKFFASMFLIGGEKFEMSAPESYLFGDNFDLNYLGGKPSQFPYSALLGNEPTQMIRALINIRKESLKLFHQPPSSPDSTKEEMQYFLEFMFDSEVDCSITIYFICYEECSLEGLSYSVQDSSTRSATFHYKAGIGQVFYESSPVFNPNNYHASQLIYQILDDKGEFNPDAPYPVVIHCVADDGSESPQSHSLIGTIEKIYDQAFSLKPLKQKIFIDGLSYLLQEIYGIENKTNKVDTAFDEDSNHSYECVICMSELRDTLILPCRHLCLCKHCANSLRYQANNCPICRVPFRALLQIKAVQASSQMVYSESLNDVTIEIPQGFQGISLVEALNGPTSSVSINTATNTTTANSFHPKSARSNISIPIDDDICSRSALTAQRYRPDLNDSSATETTISTFKQLDDDKSGDKKFYDDIDDVKDSSVTTIDRVMNCPEDSSSASSSSTTSTASSSAQRICLLNGSNSIESSEHHMPISTSSTTDAAADLIETNSSSGDNGPGITRHSTLNTTTTTINEDDDIVNNCQPLAATAVDNDSNPTTISITADS